jgi:hypothetical protein
VGKLLEGKNQKTAQSLRILDPACGSGSFLLGAYQCLLDWHLKWYTENNPEKHAKAKKPILYQGQGGAWHLTTAERKRILLNNIYGVDIDIQAVEVTKLSLLLKVLEDETGETLNRQRMLFHERALPDLGGNIKCGNSLIGPDFYDGKQMSMLDTEEAQRVNVFDWQVEFPEIFKAGGFDAVIGNPPYIRIQALKEWAPKEVEFYKDAYISAQKGNYDIYVVFVEKGFSLLNKNGRLGYILPNKFLSTDYGLPLRSHLAKEYALDTLIDFGHSQVFESATTYTCLIFLKSSKPDKIKHLQIEPKNIVNTELQFETVQSASLGEAAWLFGSKDDNKLFNRLFDENVSLLDLPALMSRGTSSGADDIFCLQQKDNQYFTVNGEAVEIENDILRKPLYATDFSRYNCNPKNINRIIFPYTVTEQGYAIVSEKKFKEQWPKTYKYLSSNKNALEKRKQFNQWYGFSAPRNLNIHDKADILVPLLANRGLFSPLPKNSEKFCLMASGGFSVSILGTNTNLKPSYILGLLNSKLLFWCLNKISNKFRSGWITCTIDFNNSAEKKMHDNMMQLVEQMLFLNKQLAEAKTAHEQTLLQRQLDATDKQIDKLVYELYDLTPAEIAIVEGQG